MSLNQVTLNGRVPHFEARYTAGEGEKKSFMNWAVSVQRDRKPADAQYYPEDLINIKAFGGQADFINNYFKAGDGIIIVGRIQKDEDYTDKDGNQQKGQLYVLVEKAMFQAGRASGGDGEGTTSTPKAPAAKPGAPKPPAGAPGKPPVGKKPGVPGGKRPF